MAIITAWICLSSSLVLILAGDFGGKVTADDSSVTKISAISLVNPVAEGGILSVLCQVWNLEEGQKVIVTRQMSSHSEILAWNKVILSVNEERVFLAERHKQDGSIIHFLTIMNVAKTDEGRYSCKVMKLIAERPKVVVWSTVRISVLYFPSDIYPTCLPGEPVILHSGSKLSLSCSSEKASPTVSLSWTKSGKDITKMAAFDENGAHIWSAINRTIYDRNDGDVYVCHLSSSAFYNRAQTCHIGPITVIPGNTTSVGVTRTPEYDISARDFAPNLTRGPENPSCYDVCPKFTSSRLLFMITAVVATILGLVFFVFVITLLVKNCRVLTQNVSKPETVPLQSKADEIYADIDGIRAANTRVYMTLERPSNRRYNSEGPNQVRYAGIYKPHYV